MSFPYGNDKSQLEITTALFTRWSIAMKTTQIKALANRRHTKAQLDRARRTLSGMTADERAAANRIATKYGITDEQAVANLVTIVDACDDDSPDIEPLTADPTETRAAVARIAAKYGITTEDIEAMSLDDFTRLVATHHRNGTPAETLAKLTKGLGKHPAEIERDAAITFAKINATEAERLRQENANTVREAAADIAALSQKHDSEITELTRRMIATDQPAAKTSKTAGPNLPPPPDGLQWVDMHTATKRLGKSRETIRRQANAGAIHYHKTNPNEPRSKAYYAVPPPRPIV